MRTLVAVALGLTLGGGLATPSFPQDVDTAPGETGFGITGGWDRWGQTLRAPEGETQLDVFSFYVYTQGPLTFTAGIYRWDGATLGASLWSTERTLAGAGRGWES